MARLVHTTLFFTLSFLFVKPGRGKDKLTLHMDDTSTRMIKKGDEKIKFSCTVNQGIRFFHEENSVDWYHELSWGGKNRTTFLYSNEMAEQGNPSFWEVSSEENTRSGTFTFTLTLLTATANHNGRVWCVIKLKSGGKPPPKQSANIVVYEDLADVELVINERTFSSRSGVGSTETVLAPSMLASSSSASPSKAAATYSTIPGVKLELDERYGVYCRAVGANPGTQDVKVRRNTM